MKTWISAFFLVAAIGLFPLTGYGQTPFQFPDTDSQFITQLGDDHYMVVEDMEINGEVIWAVWKFNKINGNWDVIAAGEPTPGEKFASGKYLFDSSGNIMIWKINYSVFLGCAGPDAGTSVFSATLSEPNLVLMQMEPDTDDEDEPIELELTRVSGTPGQIQGQWNLSMGPNNYLFNFNADGSMSVSGDVQDCLID